MGQTRGVTVTYLCAEDGIERGIEGTLARLSSIVDEALRDARAFVDKALVELRRRGLVDVDAPE